MKLFDKIKSIFFESDSFEDKWISLNISLMVPYLSFKKVKEYLTPYEEELNWKMHDFEEYNEEKRESTKDKKVFDELLNQAGKELSKSLGEEEDNFSFEDLNKPFVVKDPKNTNVSIALYPKEMFSPEEFLEIKEKVVILSYSMYKDLIYGGDDKNAKKNFRETINFNYSRVEGEDPDVNDWTITQQVGFLEIKYSLNKRVNFEKENEEKALMVFGNKIEEEAKIVFSKTKELKTKKKQSNKKFKEDKEFEKSHKEMREELKNLFGFKL